MNIDAMAELVKTLCREKGFDLKDTYECKAEKVARLHSEVSEYFDAIKKGLPKESVNAELADILFLLLNLVSIEGVDLEHEFLKKLQENFKRPYKYGTFEEAKPDDV